MRRVAAIMSVVCGVGLACGGGQKGGQDASGAAAATDSSEVPWKDKTREQRMDWMGLEVFPKMRAAFVEYEAERFSSFACQTCHGNDMEIVNFEMPNSIFALSKEDTLAKARDYDPKMTEFMASQVVPQMAQLLDMQPYDAETNTGFGCFGCHPSED